MSALDAIANEIERLREEARAEERVRWREVLEPLLDHYLNCYDGNKDALAQKAEALLNK